MRKPRQLGSPPPGGRPGGTSGIKRHIDMIGSLELRAVKPWTTNRRQQPRIGTRTDRSGVERQ